MSDFSISFMERNDIDEAAEVLSIAMLNNPHHRGVFLGNGEPERLEIKRMFINLFNNVPGVVFLAKEKRRIVGVMRMVSCSGRTFEQPDIPVNKHDIEWRKSVWFSKWAQHDPTQQHWHLGPIGVLPLQRKKGIGSALMQRFCREVDLCQAEAYLETDLDDNVRFYKKFGFRIIAISDIFGVENRYMLRESQYS